MEKCFKLSKHAVLNTEEFQGMTAPQWMQDLMNEKIVMSSLEKIPLLGFEVGELAGREITKARLTLYCHTRDFPMEVFVSTITSKWGPDSKILRPDGSIGTDSVMGLNGSMFSLQKCVFSEWTNSISIEIPPEYITAMADGTSHGLMLIDYRSKAFLMTDEGWLVHKSFYAFSDSEKIPELKVEYSQSVSAPKQIRDYTAKKREAGPTTPIQKQDLPTHSAFIGKGAGFSVFAVDEFIKLDPVSGSILQHGQENYTYEQANHINNAKTAVYDGKALNFRAVPGEKLAFQFIVRNETDSPMDFDISITGMDAFVVNKVWYLKVKDAWYPEVAVPMQNTRFSVPFAENKVPAQRYQAIFVDINLPETAGEFNCQAALTHNGETVTVPIKINVHDITLKKADFVFDMTGYSSPPNFMNSYYGDSDYFEIEDGYHRVAYYHNGQINVVPYSQNGTVRDGFAPKAIFDDNGYLTGLDWTVWDEHFGRLLDGTHMEKKTGKRIPISHMCIPVHENWPCNIDDYFQAGVSTNRYPEMVNEYRLRARSFDEDFKAGYWESMKRSLVEFIRHTDEKGWQHVDFVWYINNKHYWKNRETMIENGMYVGGTSWWLLDEPLIFSDWEAIAQFGIQLRAAQKETGSGKNFKFRIDTSYFCCMFTTLDGLVDINCLNTPSFKHMAEYSIGRRKEFNEIMWNYGQLPPINVSATQTPLHIINIFLYGGQGYLPWQNYGDDTHFEIPSVTAALYPGNRFGLKEPVPSLRFKAVRKGMEMLNYLRAFREKHGYDELQMLKVIGNVLPLESKSRVEFYEDAGTTEYRGANYSDFESLKYFILDRLLEG